MISENELSIEWNQSGFQAREAARIFAESIDKKAFDPVVLEPAMMSCDQMPGYSVLQHGIDVEDHFFRLLMHGCSPLSASWRVPSWCRYYATNLSENVHPEAIWRHYTRYHDCGKPHCRIVDEDGKHHFPDHAAVSARVWLEVGGDANIAVLIGSDMVIHTADADTIDKFCKEQWSAQDAVTLLLASLAEIHANSRLFGGMESTGFKMKWNKIDRRGRQILRFFFPK